MVLYNTTNNARIETVYTYDEWEKVYKRNKEKRVKKYFNIWSKKY